MQQGASCAVLAQVSSLSLIIPVEATKPHYIMYFNLRNVLLQGTLIPNILFNRLMEFLSRLISAHGKQKVPGIGEFISLIGSLPQKKTMITY